MHKYHYCNRIHYLSRGVEHYALICYHLAYLQQTMRTVNNVNESLKSMRLMLRDDGLARLEWDKVCVALAKESNFLQTEQSLLNLKPLEDKNLRDWFLAATFEMQEILSTGKCIDLYEIDFDEILPYLKRQGVLSAMQLFLILRLCQIVQAGHDFYRLETQLKSTQFPKIMHLLSGLLPMPNLLTSLLRSVNAQGEILSSASPELKSARQQAENAKRRIVAISDELLQKPHIKAALQDAMWVLRDGRVTLPVRVEKRGDIAGIPRGVSSTGQTVFIEPQEISAAQSQLDSLEALVQIEENKVLRALSSAAFLCLENIVVACDILVSYDDVQARAKFASVLNAVQPSFVNDKAPGFIITQARHPLFVLENHPCVPNDLILQKDRNSSDTDNDLPVVWVLTGPNAGGKTVAMRTLGLMVIMAGCGLFVPAEAALMRNFDFVFVELGDRQSREEDLSTFSGHLLHVKRIIECANRNSLVLLDEGFVGTDPAIGMVLARATLEYFASQQITTVITTHFSNLKVLANQDTRFLNASMEFESKELRPTYKLLNDIPGQSFALELAARLGFLPQIINDARNNYGQESHRVELLLAELQEKRKTIETQVWENSQKAIELSQKVSAINLELSQVQERRKVLLDSFRQKLQKRLSAFEHRLLIRERQFEKEKHLQLREQGLQNAPSNSEVFVAPVVSVAPARSAAPAASGPRTVTSFADLDKVVIKSKPNISQFTDEDTKVLDISTRAVRHINSRSLLDEARDSLTMLDNSFLKIDSLLKAEIAEQFGESEPLQKAETYLKQAAVVQSMASNFWQMGMPVKCRKFSGKGEVVRAADSKGLVECKFGGVRVKIHHGELIKSQNDVSESNKQHNANQMHPKKTKEVIADNKCSLDIESTLVHSGNTVDVRGCLVEEALQKVEQFLDKAYLEDISRIIIIHGHGTGRVKQAVRTWLEKAKYRLKFRAGSKGEGGDGATVVEI